MAESDETDAEAIARFGYRPSEVINGMIKLPSETKLPCPSQLQRTEEPHEQLGDLLRLPLELLHHILSMLDLGTLCAFKQTCHRGAESVESLPEYRDLILHGPEALAALALTKTLATHSVSTLHAALTSSRCVACSDCGPFVFLPRFERCCFMCLRHNQSLWVVPYALAERVFQLSEDTTPLLPQLTGLVGEYYMGRRRSLSERRPLVSVRAAKELAIHNGVSLERLRYRLDEARIEGRIDMSTYHMEWRLLDAPVEASASTPAPSLSPDRIPVDWFCGMASLPLPWLEGSGHVDAGLWCWGCRGNRFSGCHSRGCYHGVWGGCYACLADLGVSTEYLAMVHKAWPKADFLDHVAECPGCKHIREETRGFWPPASV